ncbi:TorD/DmsD family molecular chaperone [Adlercreutzia sp. ZJ141]|uniref:TorD/DmsD family molecular chaperone n=1 Tax=Adlercreutzia sp. ZJ141 TaxID=2709406 RepID=UPI001F14D3C9|nr:molecular chaperone TorD family protein [Adlercreutzia sp. ZJ141]
MNERHPGSSTRESSADASAAEVLAEAMPTAAESRAATYRFLSALLLNEVTSDFLKAAATQPPVTDGTLGAYFASLSTANIEQARIDAAAEFAALLLNMSPNPVAVYESVYTSPEHLMMQEARDGVLAAYRAEGFAVGKSQNLPEDHISFELEFMALLCEREEACMSTLDAAGAGHSRAVQKAFLTDHLLRWAPILAADLASKARSNLYRGLAETLSQFLEFEREEFGLPPASQHAAC